MKGYDIMKNLGFGFMRLPLMNKEDAKSVDIKQVEQMVDAFLAQGFTYFDTAYMYHSYTSENVLRETLVKRHDRSKFTVASKLPVMFLKTEDDNEKIFNEQLTKCGVDYFDYYLLHSLDTDNYANAERLHSFEFVSKMKAAGKVKKMGFSFHGSPELLDEILNKHPEVEFVQLQLNYIDWEHKGIRSRECYEVARKHNMPIIVMEPVKGGTLVSIPEKAQETFRNIHPDMSVASWAIRYAASREGVFMVLSGMSDMSQLQDNMSYMQDFRPLSEAEEAAVASVVKIINDSVTIPCTSCGYCVDGCPQKIAIPQYFALFNAQKQEIKKPFTVQQGYYENLCETHGKASDCIACKKCESVCPQHLKIVKLLKEVTYMFE